MLFPASDMDRGISCGERSRACPMEVDGMDNARKRKNGTEGILCFEGVKGAL